MNRGGRGSVGSYWPHTRIRRRGIAGSENLRMRKFFKKSSAFLSVIFLFTLGYVWTRVQVVETGYRLRRLEETRLKLKEDNHSLMVEAAMLRSPQRLEQMAAQLGLKRPDQGQVIFLKNLNTAPSDGRYSLTAIGGGIPPGQNHRPKP